MRAGGEGRGRRAGPRRRRQGSSRARIQYGGGGLALPGPARPPDPPQDGRPHARLDGANRAASVLPPPDNVRGGGSPPATKSSRRLTAAAAAAPLPWPVSCSLIYTLQYFLYLPELMTEYFLRRTEGRLLGEGRKLLEEAKALVLASLLTKVLPCLGRLQYVSSTSHVVVMNETEIRTERKEEEKEWEEGEGEKDKAVDSESRAVFLGEGREEADTVAVEEEEEGKRAQVKPL
ncbi:hypothetical protein O3P69_013951 [Scylla paramamosain]|uniref:Uncharacterized protein n=1 Tax=Scylla paramamosain TaxID=85552 RepID=A0AAW0STT9_SCYPA